MEPMKETPFRPAVVLDAASVLEASSELLELALAAGAPAALQLLVQTLETAHRDLRTPTLVVVERRHTDAPPRPGKSRAVAGKPVPVTFHPGRRFAVAVTVNSARRTRDDLVRRSAMALAEKGYAVEVVTRNDALALECSALGFPVLHPDIYMDRVSRAVMRVTADRARARLTLGDTEGLVEELVLASTAPEESES